jgi:hypothetical protein
LYPVSNYRLIIHHISSVPTYYYYYYIISFMQGIHIYITETHNVTMVYSVAGILHLRFMVHIMLYSIMNSFVLIH